MSIGEAYGRSVAVYDTIYQSRKDYAGEADRARAFIEQHAQRPCRTLLDVGCGTGLHLAELRAHFRVSGLDLDAGMLDVARERLGPEIELHHGDMQDFDLGRRFDVVTCLFSAVGYVPDEAGLNRAIARMRSHLEPGGVLLVEPWIDPADYRDGHMHGELFESDEPRMKVSRMNVSRVVGERSIMDMHHLVATPDGVEHFVERHDLGLFRHAQYRAAFESAGLAPVFDAEGLFGRGLYLATAAQS